MIAGIKTLTTRWTLFGLFLLCVPFSPAGVEAAGPADSPWPMFQHDAQHTGLSPHSAPPRLAVDWRAPVNGLPGGPAIGEDGTIYVPTGGRKDQAAGSLYAINPDGSQQWRFQFPLLGLCRQIAAYATPAIADDGTIYVHTQAGYTPAGAECTSGDSYLFAINANGTEKWHFAFNDGFAVFKATLLSSPAIGADGTIYATSADTGLYAIDPDDGTADWADSPSLTSIPASPAVGPDGTIYVSVFDLHAYEPDGDPKWTANIGNGAPNDSSPSVGADGTIYACFISPDACHAVSTAGSDLWSFPFDGGPTTPAIGSDGTIYFATGSSTPDGRLAAIEPDGDQRWSRDFAFDPLDSPVIGSDGRLYVRVDVATFPGVQGLSDMFSVLNPDGSDSATSALSQASPTGDVSTAIASDGTLYVPHPKDVGDFFNPYDPDDQHLAAYVQGSQLTIGVTGEGRVTGPGIDCTDAFGFDDPNNDCAETYLQHASVTVQATPSDGSSFTGWGGACAGKGPCSLTMSSDRGVTATFGFGTGGGFNLKKAIKRCKKKFPRGKRRAKCIKKARAKARA